MWLIILFFIVLVADMILIIKRNAHLKEAAKWMALTNSMVKEYIESKQ